MGRRGVDGPGSPPGAQLTLWRNRQQCMDVRFDACARACQTAPHLARALTHLTRGAQEGSEQTIGALRRVSWGRGRVVERLTGYDVNSHTQCAPGAGLHIWHCWGLRDALRNNILICARRLARRARACLRTSLSDRRCSSWGVLLCHTVARCSQRNCASIWCNIYDCENCRRLHMPRGLCAAG